MTSGTLPEAAWDKLASAIAAIGQSVYADDRTANPRLRAEGVRWLMRQFANTVMVGLEHDADYPQLVRLFDTYRQHGNANPDCLYFHAQVSPLHTYRIHGKRGGARMLEVQTMDSHILAWPNHKGLFTAAEVTGAESLPPLAAGEASPSLTAEPDGSIDITLSTQRHGKNWIPLHDDARWLYVRQYSYDWENEAPADLVIERVGATYPAPPVRADQIERQVEQMTAWLPTWYRAVGTFVQSYYDAPAGSLSFVQSKSAMYGMYYGKGHFACPDDAAVILEFKPPACSYWSFQLMNHYWESLDWHLRQCSLNGHQATVDPDGVFRAVISQNDPGVPNWLDPAGHSPALICGRVLRPSTAPVATMRTVPFSEIRKHVHPSTVVITPDQRSASIRRRMLSVIRRYRQ